MARLYLSLEEELNVNLVKQQQAQSEETGEFDDLYYEVKNEIEADKASDDAEDTEDESLAEDNTDNATPPDEPSADDAADAAETAAKDSETAAGDKALATATEACFNSYKDATDTLIQLRYRFATESIGDIGRSALDLGYTYAPLAIGHMYKGIKYALDKTYKGLITGTKVLIDYAKKRLNSYKSFASRIKKAREVYELIKTNNKTIDNSLTYANEHVISELKIGNSLNVSDNLAIAYTFIENHYNNVLPDAFSLGFFLKGLLNRVIKSEAAKPNNLNLNTPRFKNYLKGNLHNYQPSSDLVTSFYYKDILPGDNISVAYLPTKNLTDEEAIIKAYKQSKVFFAYHEDKAKELVKNNYATLDEIDNILTILEKISNYGMSQLGLLNQLTNLHRQLTSFFTNYTDKLIHNKEKISIRASLVEIISPAIEFFDKIYMGTTITNDEYIAKLLTNSLTYVYDSLKMYHDFE